MNKAMQYNSYATEVMCVQSYTVLSQNWFWQWSAVKRIITYINIPETVREGRQLQ